MLFIKFLVIIYIVLFPIFFLSYFISEKKKNLFYYLYIGIFFGLLAYIFVPKINYDLYRHQLIVDQLKNVGINDFTRLIYKIDMEILPLIYSYIISFANNNNLLQFFIITLGYSIILYMLRDYSISNNLSIKRFFPVFLFTVFGFYWLYFFSGLYCYLAYILFSLGFYLEYSKGKKKLPYLLYLCSLFTHNSMFLVIFILFLYKMMKNKFNFKILIIFILLFYFIENILLFIGKSFDYILVNRIIRMYYSYTSDSTKYIGLYSGMIYFIEISKMIATILAIYLNNNNINNKKNGFIVLLSIFTLLLMTRTRVAIRYVMIIQFIGITSMIDLIKISNKRSNLYLFLVFILGIIYFLYSANIFIKNDFYFGRLFY